MIPPLRIAVVGAGGLGGYLGALLLEAGNRVCLVARGDHLAAMKRGGLRVVDAQRDLVVHPEVMEDLAALERPDIALVTVKAHSLAAVLPGIAHLGQQGTVVIPLLNGVEAPARLEAAGVPPGRLAPGVAYVTAFLTGPGQVTRQGEHGRVILGSANPATREALEPFRRGLAEMGIEVELSASVDLELWRKMMVVCALTAVCALVRAPVGRVRGHPRGRALLVQAVEEAAAVARGSGVLVLPGCESEALGVLEGFPDEFYPSLIHDLKRGRPTEVDALNGAITRLGRLAGVPTPLHDAATCAIELSETAVAS